MSRFIFTLEANDAIMMITETQGVSTSFSLIGEVARTREARLYRSLVSKREVEVLEHMANGHTSFEIARSLFLSEHTVISHRKNLMVKLGARNSAHLVMRGVQLGLLI